MLSTSQSASESQKPTPQSIKLRRLTIEAAKFNGVTSGDTLPISEVRIQGEANGYTDSEIQRFFHSDGLSGASEVTVPQQGDIFGDLWAVDADDTGAVAENAEDDGSVWENRPTTRQSATRVEPLDNSVDDCYALHEQIAHSGESVDKERYLSDGGTPLTAFEAVGSYFEQRHSEGTTAKRHGWVKGRQYYAKQQYSRGMALDRQLLDKFENPTTVLLSLRLSPTVRTRLTLLTALGEAIKPTVDQLRYRLQGAPDAPLTAEEWGYFGVVAGTRKRATPHLHLMIYCDGAVGRDRFIPVVEKFVEKCEYAPSDLRGNSPDSDVISLRQGDSIPRVDDDALNPTDCEYEGRNSRGAVYALTQLPHLRTVDEMARDELLHSSTVDAWSGDAFRMSRVEIEERYFATRPV